MFRRIQENHTSLRELGSINIVEKVDTLAKEVYVRLY